MKIKTLELLNFRNYSKLKTSFNNGINFIVGKNAQGKTNLLESMYFLSVGKSPKNSKDKQIIKFDQEKAKMAVLFETTAGDKNIEIFLNPMNKKSIRINNLNILKLTELVGTLSVVYFSPDEMKLIKEVPEDRRTFLDISISQFDKAYLYSILKYNRILKMRNQILKSFDSNESKIEQLHLFTPQLIDTAVDIIKKRCDFINKLKGIAKSIHTEITTTETLDISYSYTLPDNISIQRDLEEKFNNSLEKDLTLGFTTIGPHRDDIIFKINNLDCKTFASQGQQRTVSLVVKLSLMEVIKNEIGEYPILLLDDVLSELDQNRQDRLLKLTTKYQTFISCTAIPQTDLPYSKTTIQNGTVIK